MFQYMNSDDLAISKNIIYKKYPKLSPLLDSSWPVVAVQNSNNYCEFLYKKGNDVNLMPIHKDTAPCYKWRHFVADLKNFLTELHDSLNPIMFQYMNACKLGKTEIIKNIIYTKYPKLSPLLDRQVVAVQNSHDYCEFLYKIGNDVNLMPMHKGTPPCYRWHDFIADLQNCSIELQNALNSI